MEFADIQLEEPYWVVGPNVLTNVTSRLAHLRPDAKIVVHQNCPPNQVFLIDAATIVETDLRTGESRKPFA